MYAADEEIDFNTSGVIEVDLKPPKFSGELEKSVSLRVKITRHGPAPAPPAPNCYPANGAISVAVAKAESADGATRDTFYSATGEGLSGTTEGPPPLHRVIRMFDGALYVSAMPVGLR